MPLTLEGMKKFDNFNIKQNGNSEYLSQAQKEQLKVTPMSVWNSNLSVKKKKIIFIKIFKQMHI